MLIKIIGIALVGTILSLLIKQHRPEIAIFVPILTVISIIYLLFPYLRAILTAFNEIAQNTGIEIAHIKIVLKIIGVAYICQFASDICLDAGEKTISSKIELGGKIIIITLSMPIIYNLLDLINHIINF